MRFILAIAMMLGSAGTAVAADCAPPELLNRVALEPVRDGGMMLVTASVDGTPRKFLLATGDIFSQVARTPAHALNLAGLETFKGQFNVAGRFSNEVARVGDLTMGNMQAGGFYMRIAPDPDIAAFDGILATDMMRRYDVDLDFAHRTLRYFTPEQCPGAGVYWAPKSMTVLPMQDLPGRIIVPVMLDGHRIWAMLDTGSEHSMMNPALAAKLFGVSDAAGLTSVDWISDGVRAKATRRTFSSLTLGGLTLRDVPFAILSDAETESDGEIHISRTQADRFALSRIMPDLILGMDVLSQSHLYVSFRNHRVYVSPAGDGTALAGAMSAPSHLTVWHFGWNPVNPFVHF